MYLGHHTSMGSSNGTACLGFFGLDMGELSKCHWDLGTMPSVFRGPEGPHHRPIGAVIWNRGGTKSFFAHDCPALSVAWEYPERSDELGDGAIPGRFLSDAIEALIRQGQRSRLGLSNRAITAYRRFRLNGATDSSLAVRTLA